MYDQVFDEGFYKTANHLGEAGTLAHFIAEGDRAGMDPSPYFSVSYYRSRYPDWQASGARTTVEDFLLHIDAGEMRQPHPLIDPEYYHARYPDLHYLGAKSVLHFFRRGDIEVRSPSSAFDADYYQRCYLKIEEQSPFRHYVTEGREAGHLPVPLPRSRQESRDHAAALTAGLRHPILLCCHDAQQAGVPILTLDLARALIVRGWNPVFALIWGGPLVEEFRELGPVIHLAEGWDAAGLIEGLPQPSAMPALINSAAAAKVGPALAHAGYRCSLLLHEMADYIRDQNLVPDILAARAAGVDIVASMPRMAQGLAADLGKLDVIMPGVILPPTPLSAFRRVRNDVRGGGPVFIGAGHADYRKGFDQFLEAATTLAARRPNARFVWLGALDTWSRGLADRALADGLDVVLPGFVSDALAWYRAADVYLLTSRQDPGPTTLGHAASVGTPFVGYAADIGIMDIAEGIGSFVPPGEVSAFADLALAAARSATPASRRSVRRKVHSMIDFSRYVDRLLVRLTDQPESAGAFASARRSWRGCRSYGNPPEHCR